MDRVSACRSEVRGEAVHTGKDEERDDGDEDGDETLDDEEPARIN